jgi:hypothetical protein
MGELRHTICRPPIEAQLLPQKGHRLASPPPAARENSPSPAPFFPKGWQRERVQRLARICRCIDRGKVAGNPLRRMVRLHAWRWRGRHYKTAPSRSIHFKASTILRIYRMWRKGGRTPAALALHYWRGNRKVSIAQVVELSKLCLAPETRSFSAAWRKLESPGATESAYRHATPPRLRAALAALLAHRRRGRSLERIARKLL